MLKSLNGAHRCAPLRDFNISEPTRRGEGGEAGLGGPLWSPAVPLPNNLQHPPHQRPIHLIQTYRQNTCIALPRPDTLDCLPNIATLRLQLSQPPLNFTLMSRISPRHHRNRLQQRFELLDNSSDIQVTFLLRILLSLFLSLRLPLQVLYRFGYHLLLFR